MKNAEGRFFAPLRMTKEKGSKWQKRGGSEYQEGAISSLLERPSRIIP